MLSVGARALFAELQGLYYVEVEGYVFLSAREGAERLRANKDTVCIWLKELEHYGFTVKVREAHLTGPGEGECAHYRLTDRYYHGQHPTRDFEKWDGVVFERTRKNNSPVRIEGTPRPVLGDIRAEAQGPENGNNCPEIGDIRAPDNCPGLGDISRITTRTESLELSEAEAMALASRHAATGPSASLDGWYPENWTSKIAEGVAPHPDDIANGEADSPLWVDAWLEQIPAPTPSLSEIRSALGYRQ